MDESFTLPRWARHILIGAGLFVLGGLLAFGYSWRPLHGKLTWKVAALEERLDARNLENLKLADELATLRGEASERVDPAEFDGLSTDLARAQKALAQAEKDLERATRKRKDADASASRWRKRYETLRDERAALPAAAPPPPPRPAATPPPAPTPAPIRPSATPSIEGPTLGGPRLEVAPSNPAPETGMLPAGSPSSATP